MGIEFGKRFLGEFICEKRMFLQWAHGEWGMEFLSFPTGFKEREFICLQRTTAISIIYLKNCNTQS